MNTIRAIGAFLVGLAVLLFVYYKTALPLVACLSVYCTGGLFGAKPQKLRGVLVVIISLLGLFFYGYAVVMRISNFPHYGNIVAVLFDAITAIAIFGAMVANLLIRKVEA